MFLSCFSLQKCINLVQLTGAGLDNNVEVIVLTEDSGSIDHHFNHARLIIFWLLQNFAWGLIDQN